MLKREADKLGLSEEHKNAYIYGTLAKIEGKKGKKGKK